jgi:hypothetical protein
MKITIISFPFYPAELLCNEGGPQSLSLPLYPPCAFFCAALRHPVQRDIPLHFSGNLSLGGRQTAQFIHRFVNLAIFSLYNPITDRIISPQTSDVIIASLCSVRLAVGHSSSFPTLCPAMSWTLPFFLQLLYRINAMLSRDAYDRFALIFADCGLNFFLFFFQFIFS